LPGRLGRARGAAAPRAVAEAIPFLLPLTLTSYGGIVDNPAAPSPENLLIEQKSKIAGALGWRKDVMDVIGKKGDLEMPMLRCVSRAATRRSWLAETD